MILLDVLANGPSIVPTKVQHCVIHVELLIQGILECHSYGYTSLPALLFNRPYLLDSIFLPQSCFFPSPSLGSLYTIFIQCSKATSEEGCAEVHVKRVHHVWQMTMTNQSNVSKFEKSLAKVIN